MKKILILFLLFFVSPARSVLVSDFSNMCGALRYTKLHAAFATNCANGYYLPAWSDTCVACLYGHACSGGTHTINSPVNQGITIGSYTCQSGYFLPANSDTCTVCPTGFTCAGGTYQFNGKEYQGAVRSGDHISSNITNMCSINFRHQLVAVFVPDVMNCSAGEYLPANTRACTQCPTNSYCLGGTYSFNTTTDQGIQSCASGSFSPTGSAVCYPHILHVGDDIVYVRSTKLTTPSLNIKVGNDIFYISATTTRTRMNKDSTHYFHIDYGDNHYYLCDDTTCPEGE